jgi:hypothetical protein
MKQDALFQSFEIEKFHRKSISIKTCGVSQAGFCLDWKGIISESFHSGYPELKNELCLLAAKQAVRRGISVHLNKQHNILFHNQWAYGFYHWLIESLPRLIAQREHWGKSNILLPQKIPNAWFRDWIHSISGGKIVELERGITIINNVTFTENPQTMLKFSSPDLSELASYFSHYLDLKNSSVNKSLIYVSRRNAGHRHISNEIELISRLEAVGFHSFEMENYVFPDQVRLFSNADVVVSQHGAGLANAVFMKPGSTLIEIFQEPDVNLTYGSRRKTHLLNSCFRAIAESRNVNYVAFLGRFDRANTSPEVIRKYGTLHGSIRVDVSEIMSLIRST